VRWEESKKLPKRVGLSVGEEGKGRLRKKWLMGIEFQLSDECIPIVKRHCFWLVQNNAVL
jgi:hypothetical protein